MAVKHEDTAAVEAVPVSTAVDTAPQKNTAREAALDILCGSIGGALGKVVEYPFDTVKVRLQSQPDHLPLRYAGPLDCFRQSIQQDGFRGLYRGVSAPLAGAAAETACLFWSYGLAQEFLRSYAWKIHPDEQLPSTALVTAAGMSGALTSVVLTPIELVKCRMQVPLNSSMDPTLSSRSGLMSTSLSPLAVIGDVFRREGIKGFWRGQLGTFFRETGGTAAWFGSYEMTTRHFKSEAAKQTGQSVRDVELPVSKQMASGAVAGVAYNFLFFPADTIKSKIQTGDLGVGVRPTFMNVGKELYRSHGFKGLYRGCGITVARSAPSSALIFTIVEQLKKMFS